MATAVTSQKLAARHSIETLPHVPGSASATVVTPDSGTTKQWRAIALYEMFGVGAANAVLTGNGITKIEIVAATDSTGSNTTVILDSGTLSGTAVGNGGFLECTAEQIREVGVASNLAFTHVAGRITVANSSDKCAVTYIRSGPKFPQLNLTPATM